MIPNPLIQTDARDVPISACDPRSLEDYETALYQFQSYFGDPTETLATTLENDPDFVLGHIIIASAMLMMSERPANGMEVLANAWFARPDQRPPD